MSTQTQACGLTLEWEGTLAADAQARTMFVDALGHTRPVLCLEVLSPVAKLPMHVEQPFPAGHEEQAKAAARRYRKGQVVTVQAPAQSLRFSVIADHIHIKHSEEVLS